MSVTFHNIAGVEPPPGGSHATAARGNVIVHISGQVGTDEQGQVVPGGLAAQTERAMINVALAFEAAGAKPADLVKMTTYVVNWNPSMIGELIAGGTAARAVLPFPAVALTLIGVASLFTPELLVEIEAVAVVAS